MATLSTTTNPQTQPKRKEFEAFADPNFNVRQWLNQSLAHTISSSSTTTTTVAAANGSNSGDASSTATSTAEAAASQLLSDLQIHTSDLSQQLEHSIGQALARLPRTAAEISRMALDAQGVSKQLADIRATVDPIINKEDKQHNGNGDDSDDADDGATSDGKDGKDGAKADKAVKMDANKQKKKSVQHADIDQLHRSKEKLQWCRNVLRTAQTLSQDVASIERGLKALGTAGVGGAAIISNATSSGGGSGSGGIADIEQLATAIRRINVSLGTIKAVDPTFGSAHEIRIKEFERQLQLSVEMECLDTIRGRKSCVPAAMSTAEAIRIGTNLVAAEASVRSRFTTTTTAVTTNLLSPSYTAAAAAAPSSAVTSASYAVKIAWAQTREELAKQDRANRLFAILRTIERDGVAVEALVQTSVDHLARFFNAVIVPAAAGGGGGGAVELVPGLLRLFFKCVGAQLGHDAAYLWALSDLAAISGSSLSNSSGGGEERSTTASSAMNSNIIKAFSSSPSTGGAAATTAAGLIAVGTKNDAIEETINDATAAVLQRTLEAIAAPLRKLFGAAAAEAAKEEDAEEVNVALVLSLRAARDAQREAYAALKELVSTHLSPSVQCGTPSHPNSALKRLVKKDDNNADSGTTTQHHQQASTATVNMSSSSAADLLLARLTKALPRAMHSTAARQLFSPLIESFVVREKLVLQQKEKKKGGGGGGINGSNEKKSTTNNNNTYSMLSAAAFAVDAIEPCLHRCAAFFPAETASPCLNAWSRQVATLLQQLQAAIGSDLTRAQQDANSNSNTSVSSSSSTAALVQQLIAAVSASEQLRAKLLAVQSECFASFLAPSMSSPVTMTNSTNNNNTDNGGNGIAADDAQQDGAAVVIDVDILQTCLKMAEVEVTKALQCCQRSLRRVLAAPVEALIRAKYRTLPEWKLVDTVSSSTSASDATTPAAQQRAYNAGLAGPCDAIRECCDLVMEAPVSLEAHGVADDDRAALFKSIVVEVLRMVLSEISFGLGSTPAKPTDVAKLGAAAMPIAGANVRRHPTRLLCLASRKAVTQLSADLEYLASIVDYCGIETPATATTANSNRSGAYAVDGSEANYEHPVDYWLSDDGARCVAEYEKKLTHLLPQSSADDSSSSSGGIPADLADLLRNADDFVDVDDATAATPYAVFKRLQSHVASVQQRVTEGGEVKIPIKIVM